MKAIRVSVAILTLLAGMMAIVEPASGQAAGRLVAEVVDSEGNPIPGAQVTITTPSLEDFEDTYKTNKKGRFTAVVIDATKTYDIRVEAPGFRTYETQVKPTPGEIVRQTITLYKPSEQAPGDEAPPAGQQGTRTLTEAQKVYNAGVEALRQEDRDTALAKFEEAVEMDPELTEAQLALSTVYLALGEFEKAAEAAEQVLAQDPDSVRALEIAYDSYENLGQEAKAEEYLGKLTASGGGDLAPRFFNSGVAALNMGARETAQEKFELAVQEDPNLVPAWAALSVVRLQLENFEGALEAAQRALELDPDNARAHRMRYQALRFLDRDEEAQTAFQSLSPEDQAAALNVLYNEATEFFNAGETEKAMVLLQDILAADPDHGKAHYMMGLSYVNLGDNAKAKEHLQRFVELAPEDPDAVTAREMINYLS